MPSKLLVSLLSFLPFAACAMSPPDRPAASRCVVTSTKHLAASSDSGQAVCAAIDRALEPAGAKVAAVNVQARSPHVVEAVVTLMDGRTLTAIKTSVSDAKLSASSFRMLADAVAAQVKAEAR